MSQFPLSPLLHWHVTTAKADACEICIHEMYTYLKRAKFDNGDYTEGSYKLSLLRGFAQAPEILQIVRTAVFI